MRRLLALTSTCAFLVFAGNAGAAEWPPPYYPIDEPMATAEIALALEQAHAIWGAAPDCPDGVKVYAYDEKESPTTVGRGEYKGCRIWLDRTWFASLPAAGAPDGWRRPVILCALVTHEYGHNLNYDHDYIGHDGVMQGNTPSECYDQPKPEPAPAPVVVSSVAQPKSGAAHKARNAKARKAKARKAKARKAKARRAAHRHRSTCRTHC